MKTEKVRDKRENLYGLVTNLANQITKGASLPPLADAGLRCLEQGDVAGLMRLVDRNFELRARVYPLAPVDAELVRLARAAGAAAKLCGSGGSVLGVLRDASLLERLRAARDVRAFHACLAAADAVPATG